MDDAEVERQKREEEERTREIKEKDGGARCARP